MREYDRKRLCFLSRKAMVIFLWAATAIKWFCEGVGRKGNQPEDFKEKGPKIVIILDNASYHKRLDVQDKIYKELPNIILEFCQPIALTWIL